MDFEGFAYDPQNRPARVQRTERILKDHLNLPSPWAEFEVGHRGDIGPRKADGTGADRYQFQDRFTNGGFAAAAFSD